MLRAIKPQGGKIRIRHKHPHRAEAIYRKELRDRVVAVATQIAQVVRPMIERENRNDIRNDDAADILKTIKALQGATLDPESIVRRIAEITSLSHEKNISDAVAKALGVNIIVPGSDLDDLVNSWVETNITSIQDMHNSYLSNVQRAVAEGFKKGLSTRDIANKINEQTGVSLKRANKIARNEMGNLNAEITKKRDADLGITTYTWRTMRDIRVRGAPENGIGGLYPKAKPSHVAREGQSFSYSKPPAGGNPGEAFNCRCYPEAEIDF